MLTRCSKLSDWDDDGANMAPPKATKQDKTVILKHMFTLQELEVFFRLFCLRISNEPRMTPSPSLTSKKTSGKSAKNSER